MFILGTYWFASNALHSTLPLRPVGERSGFRQGLSTLAGEPAEAPSATSSLAGDEESSSLVDDELGDSTILHILDVFHDYI